MTFRSFEPTKRTQLNEIVVKLAIHFGEVINNQRIYLYGYFYFF